MSNIIAYSKYAKELQDGIRTDLDQEVLDRAAAVSAEASARADAIAAESAARDSAISSAVAAETSARNTAVAAANSAAAAAQADADAAQATADAGVTAAGAAQSAADAAQADADQVAADLATESAARAAAVSAEASARASDVATLTAAIEAVEGGASGDTAALTARVADLEAEVGENLKDTINSHLDDAVIQTTLDAYLATDSDLSGAVATAVADRITNADDIKTKVNAFIAKFFDAFVIEGVSAADYSLTLEGDASGGDGGDGGDGGEAPASGDYAFADDTASGYDPLTAIDLTAHTSEETAKVYTSQFGIDVKLWDDGQMKFKIGALITSTYLTTSVIGAQFPSTQSGEYAFYNSYVASRPDFWFRRHPTDSSILSVSGLHFKEGTDSIYQEGAAPSAAPTGATQYFDYDICLKAIKDAHSAEWQTAGVLDNLGNLSLRVYLDAAYAVVGVWSKFGETFLDDAYAVSPAASTLQYRYNASLKWLEIVYFNASSAETSMRLSPVDMIQHTEMRKVATHKNMRTTISSAGTYSGITGWVLGSGEKVKVQGTDDFYLEEGGSIRMSALIHDLVQL